ncbi:cysteine desulfurase family protein [Clostridium botulinum]|uniref:cysteine desulfurase n=1 Tax=Clostridium botulinum TaxID=1491 RepID=A0A9Q1UYT2_CLOBO|nr:cysteine desulfurase family protein [Clostridium botulinum]AEB76750.1 cysteine desulferase [Clostridium botulinum BKT015925]KEI03140.1 cysteine desulfurase [Clostridium botulinum C/D str. Sp77]KLU76335.1 cysteine desulfurase [Clostridium botulinum V891]KOA79181.1 cysteine desulfurase [Clostridium botulinum]KOA83815.1 cysteine desulfurase [Clostridium botulinum]
MIYLDNSATTQIDPEVLDAMLPYLKEEYGNPSSRYYTLAINAEKAVETARAKVAYLINAEPKEIIFTSGASESNNFIIKGIADYKKYYEEKGNHIITSTVEHKSVLQTCKFLNGDIFGNKSQKSISSQFLKKKTTSKKIDRGYEVSFLPVNEYAQVQPDAFKNAIKQNTILASFIWGNNEIGSLNNIKSLCSVAKEHEILFHSDATQVFGKLDIDVKNIPIDFLSMSAHKIYGPKGIGAAFIKQSTLSDYKLTSLIHGGLQERGYRAGTSAVHNIVGFGKACEIAKRDMHEYIKKISQLEIETKKMLTEKYPGIEFLGDPKNHIPGVIGAIIPGIINEMLIKKLSDKCAISSGSACGIGEPSYVIQEIGLGNKSSSFVRISLSKNIILDNTKIHI